MTVTTALPRPSVRVALELPYPTAEVAEYLFEPAVVGHWLGDGCTLSPTSNAIVLLPDATVHRRSQWIGSGGPGRGQVTSLTWHPAPVRAAGQPPHRSYEIIVALDDAPAKARVAFRLSPRPNGTSRLRIQHSGIESEAELRASLEAWQGALTRIGRILVQAERSRRRDRQAVIVVHGIGEQRPGQLLRGFVANIFDPDAGDLHFVKPDYVSPLFEMRVATVPRSDAARPTTDIYELYWAHLIRDTTVAQVYGWMLRLILSRDSRIPPTLIRLVWLIRILLVPVIIAFAWLMTLDVSGWLKGIAGGTLVALPAIGSFALKALRDEFVVGYAGDAARYLEPRAENIARRQEIREAGTKLLEALHDGGRYARIIVYGHSLGSVIAYDILSHAWARHARSREAVPTTSSRALRALEDLLNPRPLHDGAVGVDQVQSMQHAAWLEYRRNGFLWRVSDFVTAGSPLAHARWLLNLDAATEFADLVRERSFPTCPPQTEQIPSPAAGIFRKVFTFTHAYKDEQSPRRTRSVQVPHHGGLFALTRWTNLYFPYTGLIAGDPIAGPLRPCFGEWIKDVKLRVTKGFAHCRYTDRSLEPDAVTELRTALRLPLRRPLADLAPSGRDLARQTKVLPARRYSMP
ncbi:SRPBCC domain-containing protein [Bradyrhizobium sp. SRS-191]|uniref:SRPBCC family protein n=1 Tax=Bradyrhizobium sp. SRS-191 TaxID=2962606 RepID=UPI00211DEF86|nr:SRPBCC domain-containing protein [Bradyrhizobium sp. SRS-191]